MGRTLSPNAPDVAASRGSVSRRSGAWLPVLCVVASLIGIVACNGAEPNRPNVLIYVIDTLRADGLASYGNSAASTPNLDALAREGVLFENAHATASWTRASLASLLTGLFPWHHGAESRHDRLPETARTLSELFAEQGYATALVSANPNVGRVFGFQQAFEDMSELFTRSKPGLVGGHELVTPSDIVTQEAVQWLRGARRPFFLVVLAIDPHHPYRPPARHDPGRHRADAPADDGPSLGPDRRRARELYQGEVAFNDESFGALAAAMKELGVWDDTIVVVTADHGEEFWEYGTRGHGKTLSEEVLRVPLIIRYPNSDALRPGTRTDRPISGVDLVPTLLGLAGITPPEALDGADFFAREDGPAPPSLAGLDLDGHRLLAAIDPPYKLVWDLTSDRRVLYDLRTDRAESAPIDPTSSPDATRAFDALSRSLAASLGRTDRTLDKSRAGPLPEDVERSLRALGYID